MQIWLGSGCHPSAESLYTLTRDIFCSVSSEEKKMDMMDDFWTVFIEEIRTPTGATGEDPLPEEEKAARRKRTVEVMTELGRRLMAVR